MNTFIAVILVCASGTATGDCNRDTATDIVVQPVSNEIMCSKVAQPTAAASGILGGEGAYLKFLCERRKANG